jgi:hypothetical protein
MKLSKYIVENIDNYDPINMKENIEKLLDENNYNIEVDPDPYLTKQYYIPFDWDDAHVMISILKEKLSDWREELEIMREFEAGNEDLWCHLPANLMYSAFDGESVKENIDPWISQIQWAEYQIAKFKEVYANK